MESLLSCYRVATKASHELLDSAFGSLDLSSRGDYARFLCGHAIGVEPIFGSFRVFVEDQLELACPDYPAMLSEDLARLGIDAGELPKVAPASVISESAAGYVLAGSRLGLASLARSGYWGRSNGLASTYMDDEQGLVIWRQLAAKLKQDIPDEARAKHEGAAAVAVFDTFREAFAASALAGAQ